MTCEIESVERERSKDLLVSVIIPVYQVSEYVERCLLSVINQTYQNIECIIVDDCSADDSIAKCERLIDAYNGPIIFRILHHERNRGLSVARNTGTDAATGDYIYYLDSDDEITPYCIEKLSSYVLKDRNIELVQGGFLKTKEGERLLWQSDKIRIRNNDEVRYQYLNLRQLNYAVWNKLIKRSFVIDNKLYNREGIICEDLLWTFYLIKYLGDVQLCNEVTYLYHIRPNSILTSGGSQKIAKFRMEVFDEILHNLTPDKEHGELKGYLTTFCAMIASYSRCGIYFNPVVLLYKHLARQYNLWSVFFTISVIAFVSRFFNPYRILYRLNNLRLMLKNKTKRFGLR